MNEKDEIELVLLKVKHENYPVSEGVDSIYTILQEAYREWMHIQRRWVNKDSVKEYFPEENNGEL